MKKTYISDIAADDCFYKDKDVLIGLEIDLSKSIIRYGNPRKEFSRAMLYVSGKIPRTNHTADINGQMLNFASVMIAEKEIPKKEKIEMRTPEAVRKELNEYAANIDPARLKPIPKGLKGKLVGELNRVFGGPNNRYIVMGWLFTGDFATSLHTSQLTDAQIAALLHWLSPKHEKEGWAKNPVFLMEAAYVYGYVAKEHIKISGARMNISQALFDVITRGE